MGKWQVGLNSGCPSASACLSLVLSVEREEIWERAQKMVETGGPESAEWLVGAGRGHPGGPWGSSSLRASAGEASLLRGLLICSGQASSSRGRLPCRGGHLRSQNHRFQCLPPLKPPPPRSQPVDESSRCGAGVSEAPLCGRPGCAPRLCGHFWGSFCRTSPETMSHSPPPTL